MLLRLRRCREMGKFQKRGLVGGDCAIEVVAPVNKVMVSGKSCTVGGGESICVCACLVGGVLWLDVIRSCKVVVGVGL
jgi:hypothetical protein